MKQHRLSHLWLCQQLPRVRPIRPHPCRLPVRPNSTFTNVANPRPRPNPHLSPRLFSLSRLPYLSLVPMPSPISATSLEQSYSLCLLPPPAKSYPMPTLRPCPMPTKSSSYLPFRPSILNSETYSVMPKPRSYRPIAHMTTPSNSIIPGTYHLPDLYTQSHRP